MKILAIDPRNVESAYVVWNGKKVLAKGKEENQHFLWHTLHEYSCTCKLTVIEQIKSYGMAVGDTIFDTVFWTGRFFHEVERWGGMAHRFPRMDVKMHLCHTTRAKDGNVIQALVDRFAKDTPNKGKGSKKNPGFFYGFKSDIWQAFALAVTYYDRLNMVEETKSETDIFA